MNLQTGLTQLNLAVSVEQQEQLLQYLHLLQKWNKAYNLTAITDFDKMISYHLLDSLSIAPYLSGKNIVDVGSGAGLPGIPLAIIFPEKKFTLIDSIGKKTRFMTHAARELQLSNVQVVNCRAEEYSTQHSFDTMIARAVASIDVLVKISKILLCQQGVLMMMKSDEIPNENYPMEVKTLHVPGVLAKRTLLMIRNA